MFVLLAVAASACRSNTAAPAPVGAVARMQFEVDLGGWTTSAEVMHPATDGLHGAGPYPVVLLICGNGPHDMDVTLPGPDGGTRMFSTISEVLAARGFAVVRYHKRLVKGPGRFDARFWRQQSTVTFTTDAGTVLDTALALSPCDRERVFLYGWSEGTAVGAALAVQRGDIDGLVLHGAVGLSYRSMVRAWIEEVGLPYARGPAGDAVTATSLAAALQGAGGAVAKLAASFLADPTTLRTKHPTVSALLDRDGDGMLAAAEVPPAVDRILDFAFSPQRQLLHLCRRSNRADGDRAGPASAHARADPAG